MPLLKVKNLLQIEAALAELVESNDDDLRDQAEQTAVFIVKMLKNLQEGKRFEFDKKSLDDENLISFIVSGPLKANLFTFKPADKVIFLTPMWSDLVEQKQVEPKSIAQMYFNFRMQSLKNKYL